MQTQIRLHRPHYELDLTAAPRRPSLLARFSQWLHAGAEPATSAQTLRKQTRLQCFGLYVH